MLVTRADVVVEAEEEEACCLCVLDLCCVTTGCW